MQVSSLHVQESGLQRRSSYSIANPTVYIRLLESISILAGLEFKLAEAGPLILFGWFIMWLKVNG